MHMHKLHARYGPVVRVAPDELTFTDPAAWKDVYAHRSTKGGHGTMSQPAKDRVFYTASENVPDNIINASNEKHALWRRTMAPSFSEAKMREQEPLIDKYIRLLIQRLTEEAARGEAANLTSWYTWTTFDIIGDLSMGQGFGCLDSSDYHPWVSLISKSLRIGPLYLQPFRALGFQWVIELLLKTGTLRARQLQLDYVSIFLEKRLKVEQRPDLIDGFIKLEKNNVRVSRCGEPKNARD